MNVPDPKAGELRGNRNRRRLADISHTEPPQGIERLLKCLLQAAKSTNHPTISLFSRGHQSTCREVADVLGTLVTEGKLGYRQGPRF